MKRIVVAVVMVVMLAGCTAKTKYGTATVTITPSQVAYLYEQYMSGDRSIPVVITADGVRITVKEGE